MKTQTQGQKIKKGKLIYSEILINSSTEKVWEVLIDFDSYKLWNPFIKSLKGNVIQGERIEVFIQPPNGKGMTFKPLVLKFIPFQEFRWIGKFGINGIFDGEHTFILQENQDGTTTFIQFERFRGILIPFLKKMLEEDTLKGFNLMNQALKEKCEC